MPAEPKIAITIGRQLGSGGASLGRRLARQLGYTYLDREILREAAEQVGAQEEDLSRWDEHISRFWDRLLECFHVGSPEGGYAALPMPPAVRDQSLFEIESRVIRGMAERHSVVVIGRGGAHVLRDHPGLVRIFLHAPVEVRMPAILREYDLGSPQKAREMIERVDQDRDRFLRQMTGRAMTDARYYDLCINTSRIPLDLAETMVVGLVEYVKQRLSAAEP